MTRKSRRKSDLLAMALDLHGRLMEAEKAATPNIFHGLNEASLIGDIRSINEILGFRPDANIYDSARSVVNERDGLCREVASLREKLATPQPRPLSWIKVEHEDQVPVGTLLFSRCMGVCRVQGEPRIGHDPSWIGLKGDLVCILALPSEIPPMPKEDA